jgi:intracellular septation protein A
MAVKETYALIFLRPLLKRKMILKMTKLAKNWSTLSGDRIPWAQFFCNLSLLNNYLGVC